MYVCTYICMCSIRTCTLYIRVNVKYNVIAGYVHMTVRSVVCYIWSASQSCYSSAMYVFLKVCA